MPTNVYTSLESISLNNENRIKFIEQLHNIFYKDGSILLYYSHIALSHIFKDVILKQYKFKDKSSFHYKINYSILGHPKF